MYFEEALKTELVTITGMSNKVYPLNAIEGVMTPYIVYYSSEGVFDEDLSGFMTSKEITCDIHILTDTYSSMKDTTRLVINKVISFQGRLIGGASGVFVKDVQYENSHEEYLDELFQYLSIVSITVRI